MSLNGSCVICTESIEEDAAATKCGHTYHYQCITEWVEQSPTCPKCRKPLELTDVIKLFLDGPDEVEEEPSCSQNDAGNSLDNQVRQQLNISIRKEKTEPHAMTPSPPTTTTNSAVHDLDEIDVAKMLAKKIDEMHNTSLFKKLEKEETRQRKWLTFKQKYETCAHEEKLKDEVKSQKKSYDEKIEKLAHSRKKRIEEFTKEQEKEIEKLSKKAQEEQNRELRKIYARFHNDQKNLKDETDKLPRTERKELFKAKKEELDKLQEQQEQKLLRTLELNNEFVIVTLRQKFHATIALIDQDFEEQKRMIIYQMNSALLELEEKHIFARKLLDEQQIKKEYKLRKTQLDYRHEQKKDNIRKDNRFNEEGLLEELDKSRNELTTMLINESNERIAKFKELHNTEENHDKWLKILSNYEEKERQIFQFSLTDHESRGKIRLEALHKRNMEMLHGLEKIYVTERQEVINEEFTKLTECEEKYQTMLRTFRDNLMTKLHN